MDHVVAEDNIQLVLLNGAGWGMYIKNITAESEAFKPVDAGNGNHNCSLAVSERDQLLENGAQKTYTLDVSTENGSKCTYNDIGTPKNRYEIEVFYAWAHNRSVEHKVGEMFSARPEQ